MRSTATCLFALLASCAALLLSWAARAITLLAFEFEERL